MKLTRGFKLTILGVITTFILLSVGVSQLRTPSAFSVVGLKKDTTLPFLRATVRMGDRYLIKNTFPESLLSQYPVVLDTYLQEDEMLQRIQKIEERASESRDILATKIVLYERMGDVQLAKEYRARLKKLDPSYQIATTEVK